MTTPRAFADACSTESNVDHCLALLDALNREVRAGPITMASQLAFVAYVVAEMEHQSPEPGVVVPALEILVRRNLQTLRLSADAPQGTA
tara:strand:- start:2658 stop:2924 length:267 start_codon:yes stop_codon:yes gene_type:complete